MSFPLNFSDFVYNICKYCKHKLAQELNALLTFITFEWVKINHVVRRTVTLVGIPARRLKPSFVVLK